MALDDDVLRRLAGDLGNEAVADVVRTYLDLLPHRRSRIRELAEIGDLPAARDAAHQLRSTSLLVGAAALGSACAELESAASAGDGERVRQAAEELVQHSAGVARSLQVWLTG